MRSSCARQRGAPDSFLGWGDTRQTQDGVEQAVLEKGCEGLEGGGYVDR